MRKFDIIGINDPRWSKIISLSYKYDSYHTQSYSLVESDGNNEPLLLVAFRDNEFIAFPIIIRRIENTEFFDSTSVYGYCGPVSSLPPEYLSIDHTKFFQDKLLDFFSRKNIISAFSRLHPLLNQSIFFKDFGSVKDINKTVTIDLKLSEEDQVRQYRKSSKSEINQLKRMGFSISEASSDSEIDLFIQIYYESMKRLNADPYYFFRKDYFYRLLDNPCFNAILLLAKIDGTVAAGGLFTLTRSFMQYHLAVTREEFRKYAPMKLIIDEARKTGKKNNLDSLHLGGGVNGNSEDSLYKFKTGFSDIRSVFKVWQLVVDESKYSYLANLFTSNSLKATNYFPVYRAKI